MRKKIVAGNWKMNTDLNQAIDLTRQIRLSDFNKNAQLILVPPFPFLFSVVETTNNSVIQVGAQNCSKESSGAFTGEVSAQMLASLNVKYVLVGHSERRTYFKESNADLADKVSQCLSNNLIPIFCCGELLEERKNEIHFEVVKQQLSESLFHLSSEQIKHIVIAYEPVWAIGTGETATPFQAQEMHLYIRNFLAKKYDQTVANSIPILYGGSCNTANAKELFALPDVDGGLIGGASLKATDFVAISNSF
ncbi:MAG: triose-phosphate isomerase [Flavobacteriales bacterium]|nr:triose-phosphate isomerase [Flavobacteriales bacterium]MCB9173718.1 triose-phosphate isomerase [Flavobacteriales bacterium]